MGASRQRDYSRLAEAVSVAGGTPGRGSDNKILFVAAVSLDEQGNRARLSGFTSRAISDCAKVALPPATRVTMATFAFIAARA